MRNDFTFYLNLIRGLVADEAGKRFSDAMLRAALRQALNDYQRAFPGPQTIAGLDESMTETTVPSLHAPTLAKGAAAAAFRIRAAAVTEVHGKRVEEISALCSAAKTLFSEFRDELAELGMMETGGFNALPSGPSFPI